MAEGRTAKQVIEGLLLEWGMDPRNPSVEFEFCRPYLKELPWHTEGLATELFTLLFVQMSASDNNMYVSGVALDSLTDAAIISQHGFSAYALLETGHWTDATLLLDWVSWRSTRKLRQAVVDVHTELGLYLPLDDWGLREVG